MLIVVKGNRYQAARAAADRHIPFAFKNEKRDMSETTGEVGSQHRASVVRWYCEPSCPPFEPGTCLFYSEA